MSDYESPTLTPYKLELIRAQKAAADETARTARATADCQYLSVAAELLKETELPGTGPPNPERVAEYAKRLRALMDGR